MINTNSYGIELSSSFNSAINSVSQYIKPSIIVEWLDSRHSRNKIYSTNSPHSSDSQGDLGYFFAKDQVGNGIRRQSYTWGVADALDVNGKTIRADGNWFAMPSDKKITYEYGWWSGTKSTGTLHSTHPGYSFSVNPIVSMTFDPRPCNFVRVFTSEYYGQIDTYLLTLRSSDPGSPNPLYQVVGRIEDGEYYFEHSVPASLGHSTVNQVELEIITTKNPNDHARVECLDVLLEEDMSDYVVSYSLSKTRDLHETSLPIGGSDSGTLSIVFDNTSKDFNVFSNSSTYGKYLTKDLRVRASSGWKVHESDDQYITGILRGPMNNTQTVATLIDNTPFPEGGVGNYFVIEIDYDNPNRELVLCSGKSNNYDINIVQRGFGKTKASEHFVGASLRLDSFEYTPYTEFFSDEWNSSTSDMNVSLSCFDWNKYMSERMLTEGFFVEKSTIPEACELLLMKTNFPKGDIDSLHRFDVSARKESGILHFDFNESTVDRAGSQVVVSEGLRSRFFSIPSAFPSKVRDITADDLDRELTQLEKALGELSLIPPDFVAVSSTISTPLQAPSYPYAIGDTGPAGGVIFITPSAIGGLGGDYYYEFSPSNIAQAQWGGFGSFGGGIFIGTTGTAIGTGYQNTIDIVNALGKTSSYAARACQDFSLNGFNDWFLPSKDELNQIYLNRQYLSSQGSPYYSSSEDSESQAWAQFIADFNDGLQILFRKDFVGDVLAVRRFSVSSDQDAALNLINFSFLDRSGQSVSENYNMVFDGFYIPTDSGNQYLYLYIAEGGVRVYIDDTIVLDKWRLHDSTYPSYTVLQSDILNLVQGKPYKIRIEAFHQYGNFSIKLAAAVGIQAPIFLLKGSFRTISGIDKIGSRNAPYTLGSLERNKNGNYNLYLGNPVIGIKEGLPSNSQNYVVNFGGGKYSRLPYHISWDMVNSSSNNYNKGNWAIEVLAKVPEYYSGDGEYLSSWSNSSPSGGFEFYSNSSSHGFKIITSSGVQALSSNTPITLNAYNHIVVSCEGLSGSNQLSYYLNGNLIESKNLPGTISSWVNRDLTFGGRGASYSTSEIPPSVTRNISMDEFVLYNKSMSLSDVKKRYTESQMQELTIYPFLYGAEESVRSVVDSITLADFGRFYINELNVASYEHMNMFFEPSVDRHAVVQMDIDDETSILSAEQLVQLQTNKVVVKVSGIASNLTGLQSLWRADNPTTLAVVNLEANIGSNDEGMFVSTTKDPPFPKAGYLIIDDEIIKYSNISTNEFLSLERGFFNTTKASHSANTKVREVRYWDLKYSKSPAFQVRKPFITGIEFEEPDQIVILRFAPTAYGAELIIAAGNSTPVGGIVFAEGTDPLTERVSYTAIAGIPVVVTDQNSQIEEQSSEIEESVAINGVKELVIENQFISDFDHAKKLADFIISKNSSSTPVLEVSTIPTPKLQVGDRIRISELDAFDIINGEYWVVAKSYDYGSSVSQSMTLRKTI
jgi:hypothetical protein